VYIKPLYGRPLPPYQFTPQIALPDKFTLEQDVIGFTHLAYSFPSGHETRAVAFSFLVGFVLVRKYGWLGHIIWLYPLLVGISRLYLFAHYPTDLVGYAILGIVLANVIAKIVKFDKSPDIEDTKFVK
jgi:undecaprenyl-diphosphatase